MRQFKFTSESVTEGHPDKVCDQIADAILDDILEHDSAGHVACEVATSTGLIVVLGEITTSHYCMMSDLARRTLDRIGYANSYGFSAGSCAVLVSIDEQSPDIARGVAESMEAKTGSSDPLDAAGAGDQGLMFGYASTESERVEQSSFMPLPIQLAHHLARRLSVCRKEGLIAGLLPDGKSQVTLVYEDDKPVAVDSVLISAQHLAQVDQDKLKRELFENVLVEVIPEELCPGQSYREVEFLVNPTGSFVKGGPEADSGLTGRKLIVDTYGGMARHGGGAFSGKDPSKVDRCASYYARYVAKNLVAAGVAERLELQVSYAIGRAKPMGLMVQTFGTSKVDEQRIEQLLATGEVFDFRPLAVIQQLDLLKPRYEQVAAYGHFGRTDLDLPWERLDKVDAVRQALGI